MFELAQKWVAFTKMIIRFAIAIPFMLTIGTAAAKPDDITEAEIKVLPRFCPDTPYFDKYGNASFNPSPRSGYWVSLMGPSFWHMHHYCWAQVNMNRSRKSSVTSQARRYLWETVRGDYFYVVRNSPPDFIMLPDIYTRIGEVELLLSHPDKANEAFGRARALKPDYWPPYSYWAEYLIRIGRRPEALKVVISGLEHAPEAKVLLEQFRFLGGKPSDIPKPLEKPKETIAPLPSVELPEANNLPAPDDKREE